MDEEINILNNTHLLFKNENNTYNNVLLHTGSNTNKEWNNLIAINDANKIITDSNVYITSYNSKSFHNIDMMLTDNNNKYTDAIEEIILHCD